MAVCTHKQWDLVIVYFKKGRSSSGHCERISTVSLAYKFEVRGVPYRHFIRVQFRHDTHSHYYLP